MDIVYLGHLLRVDRLIVPPGAGLPNAPAPKPPAAGAGLAGAPKPPVNSGERSNDVGQRDVVVRRRERGARACRERIESASVVGKGNIIHWVDPRDVRGVMYAPNAGVAGVAGAPNMSARDPSRRFNPAYVWRAAPTTLARTTQRSRLFLITGFVQKIGSTHWRGARLHPRFGTSGNCERIVYQMGAFRSVTTA